MNKPILSESYSVEEEEHRKNAGTNGTIENVTTDQAISNGQGNSGTNDASKQKESFSQCCRNWWCLLACKKQEILENSVKRHQRHHFKSLHFIFIWLVVICILGVVFTAISLYTMHPAANPANEACNKHNYEFYMCPTCNGDCDFWYFKKTPRNICLRKFRLMFDNPVMWLYCVLVLSSGLILSFIMMRTYSSNYQKLDGQSDEVACNGTLETGTHKMDPESATEASSDNSTEIDNQQVSLKPGKCSKCCLAGLVVFTVVILVVFLVLFFLYFLFTLFLKREVKLFLHKRNVGDIKILVLVIVLDLALAVVQGVVKMAFGNMYKNIMDRYLNENSYIARFIFFWVFGSFIAYFPIAYRIFFYGSIVGDPTSGYSNIGKLRWLHCPSIGCLDVALYITGSLLVTSGISFFKIIKKERSTKCSINTSSTSKTGKSKNSSSQSKTGKSKNSSSQSKTGKSKNNSSQSKTGKSKNSSSQSKTGESENGSSTSKTGESKNTCYSKKCCQCMLNFIFVQKKTDVTNYYIDLHEIYGFTVFFLTAAGFAPVIPAIVALVTGYGKIYYQKSDSKSENEILNDNVSNSENKILIDNVSNSENEILIDNVSNSENEILIDNVSNSENEILIDKVSNSENEILIDKVSNSENEILINNVSNSENDILIDNVTKVKKIWLWSFLVMTLFAMFTNIAIVIPNSRFIQHIAYSTRDGHSTVPFNFDGYLDRVLPQHSLTRLVEIHGFPNYNANYLTARDSNGDTVKNMLGEEILYLPFIDFDCLNQGNYYSGRNFTRKNYISFIKANPEGNPIVRYRNKQAIAPRQCFNFSSQCRSRGFLHNTKDSRHLHVVRSAFVVSFIVPTVITVVSLIMACCWIMK